MELFGFHRLDEGNNPVPCTHDEWREWADSNGGVCVVWEDVITVDFVLRTVFGGCAVEPDGWCVPFATVLYTVPNNRDGQPQTPPAITRADAERNHYTTLQRLREEFADASRTPQ